VSRHSRSDLHPRARENVDRRQRHVGDAVVIIAVSAAIFAVSVSLDWPLKLFQFAVDNPDLEVGDLLFVAAMLSVTLLIYVHRRWQDLAQEIAFRRSAQDRLNRRKNSLDAAVDNIPQGLVMFDRDACLVLCNRRYIEMYELTREVVAPGRTLESIIAYRIKSAGLTADARALAKAVEDTVRAGKPWRTVSELADGRSIDIITTPLRGGGWVATHEDTTSERQRAEQQLRRTEKQLRRTEKLLLSVIEHVPTIITMKDARSLKYLFVNKAGERYFGLPRSQMIGYLAHDLFSPDVADLIVGADKEVLSSGMELSVRGLRVETADGLQRVVSERRLLLKDETGDMHCLLSLIEDAAKAEQTAAA
jgi:PAS domain S-box-containing protein